MPDKLGRLRPRWVCHGGDATCRVKPPGNVPASQAPGGLGVKEPEGRCRTEHFRHTPGLCDAAARLVGGIAIEDFRDMPQSSVAHMRTEAVEPLHGLLPSTRHVTVDLEIGGKEGSHQPGPDGALVVHGVAAARVAFVAPTVLWVVRGQTPSGGML